MYKQRIRSKRKEIRTDPDEKEDVKKPTLNLSNLDLTIPMRNFLKDYYMEFSQALHSENRILPFLRKHSSKVAAHSNVTAMMSRGGSFTVPTDLMNSYFAIRGADIKQGMITALNERSFDEGKALLAIEMDYRFDSIEKISAHDVFLNHIQQVHKTVVAYMPEDPQLRLILCDCKPKPKFCNKSHKWVVAVGFHLLYNRRVTIQIGAQITHGCVQALNSMQVSDVIDNLYIEPRSGAIRKVVQLRPPYCAKETSCFYCNDKALDKKQTLPQTIVDVDPFVPWCKVCSSEKKCLDTNYYKLRSVHRPDFSNDEDKFNEFSSDMLKLLRMTSIWGLDASFADVNIPLHFPTYVPFDMASAPQPRPSKECKMHQPQPGDIRKLLVSFGSMRVKRKDEKGTTITLNRAITDAAINICKLISSHYAECVVNKIVLYIGPSVNIQLSGKGSNFCMAKNDFHTSNRAQIWVTSLCVYAGCWSKTCQGFRPIEQKLLKQASDLLSLCVVKPVVSSAKRLE